MAYDIPETWSLLSLRAFALWVAAGLEADDSTRHLAADWNDFVAIVDTLIADQRAAEDLVVKSRALVGASHSHFKRAVGQLSAEAFHVSGKRAKAGPYAALFGNTTAHKARSVGPERAVPFAEDLIRRTRKLGTPELQSVANALEYRAMQLSRASYERAGSRGERRDFDLEKARLIEEGEARLLRTERALVDLFPGDDDTIRELISPYVFSRPKKSTKKADEKKAS